MSTISSSASDKGQLQNQVSKKRAPSKEQKKAASMFNSSSAVSKGAELFQKFSTSTVNPENHNVDVVYSPNAIDNVSNYYSQVAKDYELDVIKPAPRQEDDFSKLSVAMVLCATVQKLMASLPASQQHDLRKFKFVTGFEVWSPKAFNSLIQNVGMFEEGQFKGRIKYLSKDILLTLIKLCKVMSTYSRFPPFYIPNAVNNQVDWTDVDPNAYVAPGMGSVLWIRDLAKSKLDLAYTHTWQCDYQPPTPPGQPQPAPVAMTVSFPRLELSTNLDTMERNFNAWILLLHPEMPHVQEVLAAGLMTFWKPVWLDRPDDTFARLGEQLPGDFNNLTPRRVLAVFLIQVIEFGIFEEAGQTWTAMIPMIFTTLQQQAPMLNRVFSLSKFDGSKFGTPAMMFPVAQADHVVSRDPHLPSLDPTKISNQVVMRAPIDWKNKDFALIAGVTGFTESVEVLNNFNVRVSGYPDLILKDYLKSDIMKYN